MARSLLVLDTARSTFSGAPPTLRRRASRLTVAWRATGSRQFGKLRSQRPRCDTPKEIDEVTAEGELTASTIVDVVVGSHQPWTLVGMQLRYRYRLTPTVEQRQALARAFGCARVVDNDALRLREEAHTAGRPFRSDGEVLRLVTTLAKRTPERAWLAEVSAVVLQQSVADLHRAYRNYFRALADARVADARRDLHHRLSTRLIRENQAVYLENLDVAALGRCKLAKSLADAGWGQFAAMLAYKANLYGRTVVRIDRWCPSSQQCSACGAKTGPKGRTGLKLRTWTCPACAVVHDRDVNAARNILAAGRAVTACGGDVRPGHALAVAATPLGTEAGTLPGTAA
jgi:IS605 OrfB family transposase